MPRGDSYPSLTGLLSASAVGVYLLVVAGATAAVADAAQSCSNWPVCRGPVTAGDPVLLIAWGHRIAAVAVGLLVVATAAVAFADRERIERRVLAALGVAVALFPVQVALGAVVTAGPGPVSTAVHLGVGMAIFSSLALALAWRLEPTDVDPDAVVGLQFDASGSATPSGAAGSSGSNAPSGAAGSSGSNAPSGSPASADRPTLTRARRTLAAYVSLTKPRLMWLLCLVAAAAMALAGGSDLTVRTVVLTLGGGVLAIGASGTFNHVLERDRDRRMNRTADRPLATHEVPARNALVFGFALTAASLAVFAGVNLLAAGLGLAAIVFYSVVYTLVLKPNTVQNTVIGGFAGALPALIGWAAVTGQVGVPGLALGAVIFLWTPAHFYNLALAYKEDYARGGFPMLPVVRGEAVTRKHVLLYLAATLLAAVALSALAGLGWLYAATTVTFGAVFLWAVVRLHRERDDAAAFRAFHASNAYLGALLVAIVVDVLAL
ncbi:MAG: heme o synthase [Haloarculaceae archaeon]